MARNWYIESKHLSQHFHWVENFFFILFIKTHEETKLWFEQSICYFPYWLSSSLIDCVLSIFTVSPLSIMSHFNTSLPLFFLHFGRPTNSDAPLTSIYNKTEKSNILYIYICVWNGQENSERNSNTQYIRFGFYDCAYQASSICSDVNVHVHIVSNSLNSLNTFNSAQIVYFYCNKQKMLVFSSNVCVCVCLWMWFVVVFNCCLHCFDLSVVFLNKIVCGITTINSSM